MIVFPVVVFSASSPAALPSARQLVRVRSTFAAVCDFARNPSPPHSDAVQLVSHPVAVPLPPKVARKTPASVHSVNRESCAKRLAAVAPLVPTRRPSKHLRTSVSVTNRLPPLNTPPPSPRNPAIEQRSP